MKHPVSTKMEEAWFVDPELLAGEEGESPPEGDELDVDAPKRNETLTLSDQDYEEAPELEGHGTDTGSVRYKEVSLKGAIMAPEEAKPLSTVLSRPSGLLARLRERLRGEAAGSAVDERGLLARVRERLPEGAVVKAKVKALAGKATVVADLFEQGRIPPIWLAAISFLAGVITTLIGVFLAL